MSERAPCELMPRRRQRGTAMVEFVLLVPLLAVVLGLVVFFGWAVMHKHAVLVADRYSAWQRIETGAWPSEDKINEVVFNRKASRVSLNEEEPVRQTVDELVGQADGRSARTGSLADDLARRKFPPGAQGTVTAGWGSGRALWDRIMRDGSNIRHSSGREGLTWRRDELNVPGINNCWDTLRDQFYPALDESLQQIPPPADRMAAMIRGLYLAQW